MVRDELHRDGIRFLVPTFFWHQNCWVAAGWRFLINKFLKYFIWSGIMSLRQVVTSRTRAFPGCRWGRRSSIKPQKACDCWRRVLNSTLSQHRVFRSCCDVLGLLNFFWKAESASLRPSAKNDWSSWKLSINFRTFLSNTSLGTSPSGMLASALLASYTAQSLCSLPSPRSGSPSHFALTDSCKATFKSQASTLSQNRPLGCAFFNSLRAST